MEHILNAQAEGIDFTRYSLYVESIRDKLPPHVYSFASNPEHFNLTSHRSLHDARLENVTVQETASGNRSEIRRVEIAISLLGPFHDRRIHLNYFGVTRYSLVAPPRYGKSRYERTAHGDLYTHEIRLGSESLLIHEILFERDATFLIECSDITHSEEHVRQDT
jgi:hypothetical protein